MDPLALYAMVAVLLILLSLIVAYNFVRYRFVGDRTFVFLVIFALFIIVDITLTLVAYNGVIATLAP